MARKKASNSHYGDKEIRQFYLSNLDDGLPMHVECIGKTCADPDYYIERDESDLIVFEYVLSGAGTIEINHRKYEVREGNVYIIEPHRKHRYYPDKNNPFEKIWVNFRSKAFERILVDYGLSDVVVFDGAGCYNSFMQLFRPVANSTTVNADAYLQISMILFNIVMTLAKNNKEDTTPDYLKLAKAELDAHVLGNVDIEEVAAKFNLSEAHFIREFKKWYSEPPYSYYLGQKIEYAKVVLEKSNLPLNELSTLLGFTDEFYFSRVFKRKTGISPGSYRKGEKQKSK